MKTQNLFVPLAFYFGIVPAAIGQQNQTQSLSQIQLTKTNGDNYIKPTPEQEAKDKRQWLLTKAAAADLHTGLYAQAELEAKQALSFGPDSGVGYEVLGSALEAQGKDQEALQLYKIMVVDQGNTQPRNLLPYAQLLLKSGQWAQAVAVYNQVLPHLPDVGPHPEIPTVHDGDVIRANSHFSPDLPEPAALATAIHIARGMVYNTTPSWSGESQDQEAMAEYAKALQSAPDNALANYYYGVGWQKLAPVERVKFGTAQQAKAALQKAVKIGNADVKKAAERALKDAG